MWCCAAPGLQRVNNPTTASARTRMYNQPSCKRHESDLITQQDPDVALTLHLIRFITADADFTLLWAAAVGKSPGVALRQKVVWITGASSGIGEELACQLAAVGARLVLSARRENELHRVRRKCLERSSLEEKDILVLPLDLLDGTWKKRSRKK
ncbi:hypothetical protein AMELA_G00042820 [Ameiurus melas]|uniref:Dehydrogenase/reductase SDR family member 7 n=1 Tax=Ameiurus melas TaxID=219545 RepID=A0A7J6B610_AMEME|nr:hypothetical protein AMELA_G00042820 [Ameiurus melas]